MTKLYRNLLSILLAVTIPLLLMLTACNQETTQSQRNLTSIVSQSTECSEINLEIGRSNSVYGKKDGKLFGYVDLAENIEDLLCYENNDINLAVKLAVEKAVNDWWKTERFIKLTQAEIHIITILDKNEYARADFNAAKLHGVLNFTKKSGKIIAGKSELDFSNIR